MLADNDAANHQFKHIFSLCIRRQIGENVDVVLSTRETTRGAFYCTNLVLSCHGNTFHRLSYMKKSCPEPSKESKFTPFLLTLHRLTSLACP